MGTLMFYRRPNVHLQPSGMAFFSALPHSYSHRTRWELMSLRSHTWATIQTFSSDSLLGPSGIVGVYPTRCRTILQAGLVHQLHPTDHGLDPFLMFPWGGCVTNHTEDLAALSTVEVSAETQNHLVVFRVARNTHNQV